MTHHPPIPDASALLEHARFLRALSRSLLGDEHAAQDNVQQTMLTALEHPPKRPGNLRAWLGVVARNLAFRRRRTAMRRTQRERAAAVTGSVPATDGVAGQLELQRLVVEAVTALDEPYKSTVVMRYFREQTPTRIAVATGVSVETVKTRLKRALKRLRSHLDGAHAGGRKAWMLALAPIAHPAEAAAAAAAAAALRGRLAAGLVLLCVATTVWLTWRAARSEPLAPRSANAVSRSAGTEAGGAPEMKRDGDAAAGAVAGETGDTGRGAVVSGIVRLEGGGSPRRVVLALRSLTTRPDAQGRFAFPALSPGACELTAGLDGFAAYVRRFDLPDSTLHMDVWLRREGAARVRVVGPWGAPLSGLRIEVVPAPELAAGGAAAAAGSTDRNGELTVAALFPGPHAVRFAKGQGLVREVAILPGRTTEVSFEVSCGVTGRLLAPDGRPIAGAAVRLVPRNADDVGFVEARTDRNGRYEAVRLAPGNYGVRVEVFGQWGYTASLGSVALAPGQLREHPLRLGAGCLSGRVAPAAMYARVQATPVEVCDKKVVRVLGATEFATLDAEGRYRFAGLRPGHYRLFVAAPDPAYADALRLVDFTKGGSLEGIDFALRSRRVGKLRIEVMGPDGTPASGVDFWLQLADGRSRTLRGRRVEGGVYEFEVEAGACVVVVGRRGGHGESLAVEIRENETVSRRVSLREEKEE